MDILQQLYETVLARKGEKREGSYTCYLFEQGTDKILKKCGEECSEVIIAAKNGDNAETVLEISDLLYHLTVLMVNEGIASRTSAPSWTAATARPATSRNSIRWTKTHDGRQKARPVGAGGF